jgi:hypothetical protein
MDQTAETLRLDYDRENDVLRALFGDTANAIAIPRGDVTILVSEDLTRIVGVVFEDYAGMLKRTQEGLKAPSPVDSDQLLAHSR